MTAPDVALRAGRVRNAPVGPCFTSLLAFLLALAFSADAFAAALEVRLTDQKGQPVADAVVSLVPLDAPAKITPPAEPIVITQSGQEFSPYVTAVLVGSLVNFYNNDKIEHHVYSLSGAKRFDLPLSGGQAKKPVLFDNTGVVSVGCNIHEWMSAYVIVLATPFFSKSNESGAVTLPDAPAGRYRLEIWQARLAKPDIREITLPTPALGIALTLGPDRRIRRPANAANGGGYK